MQYIFGTLITASGQLRPLIIIAIIGMVINVVLNAVLIPTQGAQGAAYASCITQLVVLLAQVIIVIRVHAIAKAGMLFLQTVVFATLCIAYGFFLDWNTINPTSLVWSIGLFGLGCLLIATLTGMLSIKRFVALLRQQH